MTKKLMGLLAGIGLFVAATSTAHATLINADYTGTVNGANTDFGFGTIIDFMGTYDTDDVNAPGDKVIFQTASLSVGGIAQTGVSAFAQEDDDTPGLGQFFVQWDSPPTNPDLAIYFEFSTVFPDLIGLTSSNLVGVIINHDGALPDDVSTTAFSVTDGSSQIPEPTTLLLMSLGLAGIGFARKTKKYN